MRLTKNIKTSKFSTLKSFFAFSSKILVFSISVAKKVKFVAVGSSKKFLTRNFGNLAFKNVSRKWRGIALGGAVLGGTALAWSEWKCVEKREERTVDYEKLRSDLENMIENVFKKNAQFGDTSFPAILVRIAWESAGDFFRKEVGKSESNWIFHFDSTQGGAAAMSYAREQLDLLKKKYPGLSYPDLYTLAGVMAIKSLGGPTIEWKPGRRDSTPTPSYYTASPPSDILPDSYQANPSLFLRDLYRPIGFTDQVFVFFFLRSIIFFDDVKKDIVVLAAAHALSRTEMEKANMGSSAKRTSTYFSNQFYRDLLQRKWLEKKTKGVLTYVDATGNLTITPSDYALIQDPKFREYVELYAKDQQRFFSDFSQAFSKLIGLGLTFKPTPTPNDLSRKEEKSNSVLGSLWDKIFH